MWDDEQAPVFAWSANAGVCMEAWLFPGRPGRLKPEIKRHIKMVITKEVLRKNVDSFCFWFGCFCRTDSHPV